MIENPQPPQKQPDYIIELIALYILMQQRLIDKISKIYTKTSLFNFQKTITHHFLPPELSILLRRQNDSVQHLSYLRHR